MTPIKKGLANQWIVPLLDAPFDMCLALNNALIYTVPAKESGHDFFFTKMQFYVIEFAHLQ